MSRRRYFDRQSDADHRLEWVIIVIALVVLVIWVFADVRRRGRINPERPEVHRTDLTAYTAAADVWWNGGSSLEAFSASSPRGWRYQYPPFFGTLMGPLSQLGTKSQAFFFGLFSLALLFGVYLETKRLLFLFFPSGLDPPPWIPIFAGIAFALPMLNTIQRGQVGLLVIYPLMLGFRLIWTTRPFSGGIALAFPAVLKILPTLSAGSVLISTVAPLFRTRDKATFQRALRSCVGFAFGIVLFLLLIPAILIGWQNNIDGIRHFLENVAFNPNFASDWGFDIHSVRNQSLAGAAWQLTDTICGGFGRGHEAATPSGHPFDHPAILLTTTVARWLILAFFLATAIKLSSSRRTLGTLQAAAVVFGLSCVATLVFSPVAWGHHFVQGMPGWIAIPAWFYLRGHGRSAYLFALVPAVLILAHYILMSFTAPLGLLGFGTTAWLLCACVCLWRRS